MARTDLEFVVHRRLQELPVPSAPATLLPRVMQRVQAWAARPWYQRAWFTWPAGWQAASVAAFGVVLAVIVMTVPSLALGARAYAMSLVGGATTQVPDLGPRVEAIVSAAQVLWHALVHPVLVFAFVLVLVMALMCATVAVALNRVVFGKPVHS
jgi:hypothetical protein